MTRHFTCRDQKKVGKNPDFVKKKKKKNSVEFDRAFPILYIASV